MSLSNTQQLAIDLIKKQSVTPDDAGCQALLSSRLAPLGFDCKNLKFGDVDNLWSLYGDSGPIFCFAGHTDVVPSGDENAWHIPPFQPSIEKGVLYGRGAADMKGSIAAMVTAVERFIKKHPNPGFRIAWLITSDEEGPATEGTVKVVEWLEQRNIKIDWCLVGEPSSSDRIGDTIKNGRRGSLGAHMVVKGIQGHVAYPQLAKNPIHAAAPALAELVSTQWDLGNDSFPQTSCQISNISAGTGATNVIPGSLEVDFNFRFSTEQTPESLKTAAIDIFNRQGLDVEIDWQLSGMPFLTASGSLVKAAVNAISNITGYEPQLSTAGGTSDGRFIAPTGAQVVELGPVNASIHQVNECVSAADLDTLSAIYEQILVELKNSLN